MLASGATDWPRLANGDIDVEHPGIARWRSGALNALVTRAAAAAHGNGGTLDMDVRAPWDDPAGDRPESGHDYTLLASATKHGSCLWNYFGLNGKEPGYSAELARAMAQHAPAVRHLRWDGATRADSAEDLAAGLAASVSGGATAVAVPPSSMLDDDAWAASDGVVLAGPTDVSLLAFVFPFPQRMS